MRRVLTATFVAAVTVGIAWLVAGLPGALTANIGPWSVRAPTSVAATLGVILLVALYFLVRLLVRIITLPRSWRRFQARNQRDGGDKAVSKTLLALAANEAPAAQRHARQARAMLGDTPQTLLLCAEAARLAGDEAAAAGLYRKLADRKDGAFLGLRGLLRQAIQNQDWVEAGVLARQAEALRPGATWLREARLRLASQTGAWHGALALAGPDAPLAALATAAADAETDPGAALKLARRAWKDDPSFAPAVLGYATRMREAGHERRAVDAVRAAWKTAPHPDLAAFVLAGATTPLARVKLAGQLAAANPEHPETRLMLARANLDAGLTGEARRYAEAVRATGLSQRRLFLLLAEIEEAEHGATEAGRAALREATQAGPDPRWHCSACGAGQTEWRASCDACHTPASLHWGQPGSVAMPLRIGHGDR